VTGINNDVKNEALFDTKDHAVELTNKEKQLVLLLVSNVNNYVSIERIKDEVWNDSYVNDVDVRMCIKNIRKKTSKDFICSLRGVGYRVVKG